MTINHLWLLGALSMCLASIASARPALTAQTLAKLAPAADIRVLNMAFGAVQCAQRRGIASSASRLAVIDYSQPSLKPRLWVFDIKAGKLLYEEVVAHGQGSGHNVPHLFSNKHGTHQSSLGLFVTADAYNGRNGYSLRMRGLEPGFNDQAMARAIVMHGAAYVNPVKGHSTGRLGRSWGCPAVRTVVAKPMIDTMKEGQFLFAYYPDPGWLKNSQFLTCH